MQGTMIAARLDNKRPRHAIGTSAIGHVWELLRKENA